METYKWVLIVGFLLFCFFLFGFALSERQHSQLIETGFTSPCPATGCESSNTQDRYILKPRIDFNKMNEPLPQSI